MKVRIFITGIGIITPIGSGIKETKNSIQTDTRGIGKLDLFQTFQHTPLPVGKISSRLPLDDVPRTHILASIAADEALKGFHKPVDAVIMGTTTGGMLSTEGLLKQNEKIPDAYQRWP